MTLSVDKIFLRLNKFDLNMPENTESHEEVQKEDVDMNSDGDSDDVEGL